MRAEREDIQLAHERRSGNYTMLIAGGSLLVLAILLYIGFSGADDAPAEVTPLPVVRDSAITAPPVVDNAANQAPAAQSTNQGGTRQFNQRQLSPPTDTVGAGAAPTAESTEAERLVIDGELLEELERDAETEAGDTATDN